MKPIEAYWKLDHTICMNSNEGNIKWNIDNKEDYPEGGYDPIDTDCKSIDEAIDCLETIEKALNMLDLLRNALTLEVLPIEYGNIKEEHPDGSWSYAIKQTCNFVAHKLDEKYKKELTKWIIENIDKDTVRKWLEEDNVK